MQSIHQMSALRQAEVSTRHHVSRRRSGQTRREVDVHHFSRRVPHSDQEHPPTLLDENSLRTAQTNVRRSVAVERQTCERVSIENLLCDLDGSAVIGLRQRGNLLCIGRRDGRAQSRDCFECPIHAGEIRLRSDTTWLCRECWTDPGSSHGTQ